MDSWVGSGVDMLTLLDDVNLKIQLPCHERNFNLRIPCITEMLDVGRVFPSIPQEQLLGARPGDNIGTVGFFIRIVSLRKKALR